MSFEKYYYVIQISTYSPFAHFHRIQALANRIDQRRLPTFVSIDYWFVIQYLIERWIGQVQTLVHLHLHMVLKALSDEHIRVQLTIHRSIRHRSRRLWRLTNLCNNWCRSRRKFVERITTTFGFGFGFGFLLQKNIYNIVKNIKSIEFPKFCKQTNNIILISEFCINIIWITIYFKLKMSVLANISLKNVLDCSPTN